jgi:hydroxymethylpyrimidine pyrophosphatase-like HAD family hydrolase
MAVMISETQVRRGRVAAIGDSASDISMLEQAGLRFFVAKTPPQISDILHLPNVDVRTIADQILAAWK